MSLHSSGCATNYPANAARGADPEGYRAEFVRLVKMAETLGAVAQR